MPRKGSFLARVLSVAIGFLWSEKPKRKPPKRRRRLHYGISPHEKNFKSFYKNIIMNPTYTSTGDEPGLDSAAELFLHNGELRIPMQDEDFRMCPITRWYDPDCVPAIVSEIAFDRKINITTRSGEGSIEIDSNVLTILFGAGQYILLPSGIPVPQELLAEVEQHFQSRGISKITDGKSKPFWSGVDLGNGQDYSAITVAGCGPNGRGSGTSGGSGKNNPYDFDWIFNSLDVPSKLFDDAESSLSNFTFSSQEPWWFESRK